jgi:3-phenylpropionate/trans-cinnamate dioxygenase ferredoxin reductase component
MTHYPYLIIGGGMTADAAVRGIRELDPNGAIGLIGNEADPPYSRPPLTKALWKGDPFESIWRNTADAGVDMHLGRRVVTLDRNARQVTDNRGGIATYDRLMLATGAMPRHLPFGGEAVTYYRTLQDYQQVRELADKQKRFVVIGGGFIGSEIAAALAVHGCQVTMLFPEAGIGARLFPADLAAFLVDYYRLEGVDVRVGESVLAIARVGSEVSLTTQSGFNLRVDAVIAGIGVAPNVELAQAAGLTVSDGIVVDQQLRSNDPAIFAAGDVARFTVPSLGTSRRVEHEDNALTMGRAAGRAMAGDSTPYTHLPFFYSDLFDLGYEAVGEMDPRGETFADWTTPFRDGVVYYLKEGRVRGALLWNRFGKVDEARTLIAEPGPFTAANLKGRIGK